MDSKLFEKYIRNQCSPQELEQVQRWINAPENKEEVLDMFSRYWDTMPESAATPGSDLGKVLNQVLTTIGEEQLSVAGYKNQPVQAPKTIWRQVYPYAAAVLLIITSVVTIYLVSRNNRNTSIKQTAVAEQEIIIERKTEVKQIFLSDGSKVWLNAGSSLQYPDYFTGSTREVYLDGEAFFDVAKNPGKPFLVKTSGYTIKVLGTSFNVKSYQQDETIETVLATGKIFIEKPASKANKAQQLILQPSQGAVFSKRTQVIQKIERADIEANSAWKEGILLFKNSSFEQVVAALERWYGVDIVHKNISSSEFRLTARFEKESLNEVLAFIKLTLPVEYTIEENKVIIQ